MAQDFLRKAIEHDKSCSKAWEYLGLIMEKEASYKDAADHYEQVCFVDEPTMLFRSNSILSRCRRGSSRTRPQPRWDTSWHSTTSRLIGMKARAHRH
jgi:cytochrome c-type biogenesis protein CcmH/NrfG